MRDEGVTFAAGVQTVWLGVLDHLDAVGGELPALKRILIGGAKCPVALIRRMETRLGASVQTSWGMTELSPLAPWRFRARRRTTPRPSAGGRRPQAHRHWRMTLPRQRGVVAT